ncbi:MAG: FG-GAP-like repeat-containing protein [Acidobacteriota bacterium]
MRRIFILITSVLLAACGTTGPKTETLASTDAVRAFYLGLAALQVGDDIRAKSELTKATELAASEPAAWVNLGILQIRQKDLDAAGQSLELARTLADKNPRVYETIALLERQRGNFEASQTNLQKAIELDANNVKATYALAKEKERQTDDAAARSLYEQILRLKPDNTEAKLEAMRLAAKQNDTEAVKRIASGLSTQFPISDSAIKAQFDALNAAVASGDMRSTLTETSYLRNVLLRDPSFRASIAEVRYSETTIGEPFTKPLILQVPSSLPAPADTGLSFELQPADSVNARWSKFVYLNGDEAPVVAAGNESETRVGKATVPFAVESAECIAAIDFDYDFKNDIAFAGAKGFKLFKQSDGGFSDVTAQTKLATEIVNSSYSGVWVLDVESDGDLDLVVGRTTGGPIVLQNNSDGTFSSITPFIGIDGLRQFASVDLDEDGDADVLGVDTDHRLHYFANERGGLFRRRDFASGVSRVVGFDVGDVDGNGKLELVVVHDDGAVWKIADKNGVEWDLAPLFQDDRIGKTTSLILSDLDNNGVSDIVLTGEQRSSLWLRDPQKKYVALDPIDARLTSIADINNDGRLDLIGDAGIFLNRGTKNYNWQAVRPRAAKATGDQRVNSFGIGGELELRSGLSLQKRLITEPVAHFGLGENAPADVLRVVWQNGFVQAEFDMKPNQTIAAEQRLKGSCPHLFAFDGEKFKLVKDAPPWSPALGLKINAQDTFGVIETEEWFKVPGEALKPTKENFYELRITGEYWESYYIDQYSLLVVDHPENTEVFTDERFSVPPPPLEVFTTGPTREFVSAKNDKGDDVSAIVKKLDEKYLDGFERGTFQGVAADHFVELELSPDAPADKRIAIVADGWMHPTDASINVQLGQSGKEKPRSLSLEVRDASGAWKVAKENLGFPAGKMKTLLFELPIGASAARLRTNMEVFWDKLAWAVYDSGEQSKTKRLELTASELRHRGFSVIEKADDSSPEKPDYDRLLTTGQRWRDMEGYFTRFGDVLELLTRTDDRYVLMNAGDELVLKFEALPEPAAGYKRDFVLIGNGWIKDGDLNSVFSKTLIPLPTHASNDYSKPPTILENDPVYQENKADWLNFHTRYVSPDGFRNALR